MSSSNMYTPGPWYAMAKRDPDPAEGTHWIRCSYGALGYWRGGKSHHTDSNWILNEPDANLIAAAPEMIEALIKVDSSMADFCVPEDNELRKEVKEAITKARGGQPVTSQPGDMSPDEFDRYFGVLEADKHALEAALWEKQMELYPHSVRMTYSEVLDWALAAPKDKPQGCSYAAIQASRLRRVAVAMQYPLQVWYRTVPADQPFSYIGCRIGLLAHEYVSNFNDFDPSGKEYGF